MDHGQRPDENPLTQVSAGTNHGGGMNHGGEPSDKAKRNFPTNRVRANSNNDPEFGIAQLRFIQNGPGTHLLSRGYSVIAKTDHLPATGLSRFRDDQTVSGGSKDKQFLRFNLGHNP